MAEPDAAGPAPIGGPQPPAQKGSRSLTLADIQRDIDRATAPLRAAQREADRSMAPVFAVARQFERDQRRIAAMVDKAIGPYLRTLAGPPSQKKATPTREDSERRLPLPAPAGTAHAPPAFDASPSAMSALVDTVAAEVLKTLTGSRTGETAAFTEEIRAAVADEVRKAIAEAVAPPKDRKPRGDSTCERLRDLHLNVDPEFAETATLRKLAKRIGRSTGAIDGSPYYKTKLKGIRAVINARKKEAKRAQKWGDFNSIGRSDEEDKGI
jgi:hypothetical protein